MQRCYCVHTQPHAEVLALEQLQRQGFGWFLPRIRRMALRSGRRRNAVDALCPRYLFLRADVETTSPATVRPKRGAVGLVRIASEPAAVSDELAGRLRAVAIDESVIALPERSLRPDQAVMTIEGSLEGMQRIYTELQGEYRALVLIQIPGGIQSLTLSINALTAQATMHAA
jgi:transcription antitermination factor NusG